MYLGIDIGTSAVKALLSDDAGNLLAETEHALSVSRPQPLWSEQDPQQWWQAVNHSVLALRQQNPTAFAKVQGIGLSGQMHGAVVLGADDQPLRPAILWNDGRSHTQCTELSQRVPDLAQRAGVIAMPGLTAPKLLWLAEHEPDCFRAIKKILLPKDYIRLQLSGEHISDMSDAAGTLWLDQAQRDWNLAAIEASGLQREQFPKLVEGSAPAGQLRAEVAQTWDLPSGVCIAGGGGDAATGGVGIGAINDGDGFISLGTSGQLFVVTERFQPKPEVLLHSFAHAIPERWYQMAAMLNGASCLAWLAGALDESDIGALLDQTEADYRQPSELLFLPYLSGERTPHNNPHARGVFFGLAADTSRTEMVQAVLEGVAYSFADAQHCLQQVGTTCQRLGIIGGGARSRFWAQIMADVLGCAIQRYKGASKGPAFGAARLAQIAVHNVPADQACQSPELDELIEPNPHLNTRYAENIARYRRLYQQLKQEFDG